MKHNIKLTKKPNPDITYIRLYIEYKDPNGKWVMDTEKCKRCDGVDKKAANCYGYQKCNGSNRIYPLFSILANVRIKYHGLNIISEPRGIPQDASREYILANSNSDNHSHSYHTLKQLKEYDGKWDNSIDKIYNWELYLRRWLPSNLEDLAKKHGGDDNVRIIFYFFNPGFPCETREYNY